MPAPDHGGELISSGSQGVVYKVRADSIQFQEMGPTPRPLPASGYLIVKEAMGLPGIRALRRKMIRREYEVYRRLEGLPGIPECYGLMDEDHLMLEFIDGHSLRLSMDELPDRDAFFSQLLQILLAAHGVGIAHSDMKRKDNILVTPAGEPRLVDFGSAVIRKDAGAVNHWMFRQACQIDFNAWVKHKYLGRYDLISTEDAPYFRLTSVERWTAPVRKAWRKITARHWREHRRGAPQKPESHR
jgi:serine/threonine protein kinase